LKKRSKKLLGLAVEDSEQHNKSSLVLSFKKERFSFPLRVRWAECDMQGIVFNPHYLMYFDVAFTEYMRALGMPYPEAFAAEGTDNFMVSVQADFRASARYDDELEIGVRTAYLGTTSFRMAFSVRRGEVVLVEGVAVYVNGDRDTHAPRPLPARLVHAVEAYEHTAPEKKPPKS
jgi:acyl-CoA thioester hydrolase